METTSNEEFGKEFFTAFFRILEAFQAEDDDESSHRGEGEASSEDTTEKDVSEEEVVPRPRNAEGKCAAPSMPSSDQSLDKHPRQYTAEEEFDIDKVVGAIEQTPLRKKSHKAALCEKCDIHLALLAQKVVNMDIEACEEGKKNKEFREEMRTHWEEEKKHREEMRKFMIAISKAFGVTAQAENK